MEKIEKLLLNYGYIKDNENLRQQRKVLNNASLELLKKIKRISSENKAIKDIKINEEIKYITKIREELTNTSLKRVKIKDKEKLDNIFNELTYGEIKVGYCLKYLKNIEKNLSNLVTKQLKSEDRIIDKVKNELSDDEYEQVRLYIESDKFREIISRS